MCESATGNPINLKCERAIQSTDEGTDQLAIQSTDVWTDLLATTGWQQLAGTHAPQQPSSPGTLGLLQLLL
jgi:hypothetical protein